MTASLPTSQREDALPGIDTQFISRLISQNGPRPADYAPLNAWLHSRPRLCAGSMMDLFGLAMQPCTLQGHAYHWPHGYPGDYQLIDHIHTRHISADPRLERWDQFFQQHPAQQAVRNRVPYLCHSLEQRSWVHGPALQHLLVLGSGPGRDIYQLLRACPELSLRVHGIDTDPLAVNYANTLNARYSQQVKFRQGNALSLRPDALYDFIWCSTLFDYYSDALFIKMVRRYMISLRPGGELVIGNFSPNNRSRSYMEFVNWALHYRSTCDLMRLAKAAGVDPRHASVHSEPTGVGLFLHLRRPYE
jgi:extracellular factor (EF) 3-hydroxypalmitic acid methyl ester biosynthesis protein